LRLNELFWQVHRPTQTTPVRNFFLGGDWTSQVHTPRASAPYTPSPRDSMHTG